MIYFKKILLYCFLALGSLFLCSCITSTQEDKKIKDLDFTILDEQLLSKELKEIIEEKKAAPFQLTFHDQDFIYICIGYGEQETGGYSIAVNDLYLTENSIYVDTNLLGPSKDNLESPTPSYPYIIIKTNWIEKPVIFK